jgi:hypothetical protein
MKYIIKSFKLKFIASNYVCVPICVYKYVIHICVCVRQLENILQRRIFVGNVCFNEIIMPLIIFFVVVVERVVHNEQ